MQFCGSVTLNRNGFSTPSHHLTHDDWLVWSTDIPHISPVLFFLFALHCHPAALGIVHIIFLGLY